ncbi:MAG: PAS domain S-box protein [Alphaproteobacteria bacterium]|nr:PAS domain S-box protein [Alphaproteobacteria bacterium]
MFNKQNSDVIEPESVQNALQKTSPKSNEIKPTDNQLSLNDHEIIVSKTDLAGKIKYVNDTFIKISGYSEVEMMGAQHNVVRHPVMPRAIFHLLWERLSRGKHVFAYLINLSKNGDHYWVMAHICPSFDAEGSVIGYHSSRRKPDMKIVNDIIIPLYKQLSDIEASETSKKAGLEKSIDAFDKIFRAEGVKYNEFILSL